jgi:hypothetical protein
LDTRVSTIEKERPVTLQTLRDAVAHVEIEIPAAHQAGRYDAEVRPGDHPDLYPQPVAVDALGEPMPRAWNEVDEAANDG